MDMQEENINKKTEESLHSLDGLKRAQPKPFLLTRVMAAIHKQQETSQNVWSKAGAFISRPGIAFAGMVLIICINLSIFFISRNNSNRESIVQNNSLLKDEFAINASTIYDLENPE